MNVSIYYFSGTGNTAWVVSRLAKQLAALGDSVDVASCEGIAAQEVDPAACDVMGIAFPVHASFAPRVFRRFLRGLPEGGGRPLFALTTAAYASGDTAWHAARPLRDKGYTLFLADNVMMGNNLHLPRVSPLPVASPERMAEKRAQALVKIEKLAALIHHRRRHIRGRDPLGWLLGVSQRVGYERLIAAVFDGFWADETCTQCGWCISRCPMHNIEMAEQGVVFGDACILCMRCYSFCPVHAIQATEKSRDAAKYRRYQGPEGKPYGHVHRDQAE